MTALPSKSHKFQKVENPSRTPIEEGAGEVQSHEIHRFYQAEGRTTEETGQCIDSTVKASIRTPKFGRREGTVATSVTAAK